MVSNNPSNPYGKNPQNSLFGDKPPAPTGQQPNNLFSNPPQQNNLFGNNPYQTAEKTNQVSAEELTIDQHGDVRQKLDENTLKNRAKPRAVEQCPYKPATQATPQQYCSAKPPQQNLFKKY